MNEIVSAVNLAKNLFPGVKDLAAAGGPYISPSLRNAFHNLNILSSSRTKTIRLRMMQLQIHISASQAASHGCLIIK